MAGHLICRAAYRSRVPLAEGSGEDELKKNIYDTGRSPFLGICFFIHFEIPQIRGINVVKTENSKVMLTHY